MENKRKTWIFLLIGAMILSLGGQVAVLAGPEPAAGTALGAYAPDEQIGHLTFSGPAPEGRTLAAPNADFAAEVVRLINEGRLARGLAPFKVNPILTDIALAHSEYMRDHGCFDHQCPGEPAIALRACNAGYGPYGWGDCYVGETIGAGHPDASSVVADWLESPPHQDVLLDGALREFGVGVAFGGEWGVYITADFGSQPDVLPVFINDGAADTDNREVTLTLTNETVSDWGGIGYANEVMISNDPTFPGAAWQPYALRLPWTLSEGGGQKMVYVKYRDCESHTVVSTDEIWYEAYDLEVGCGTLTFFYEIGQGFRGPTALSCIVKNGASTDPLTWTAEGGAQWLDYNPDAGQTPADLTVSVNDFETGEAGTYQTTITVSAPEIPGETEEVTVTIRATEKVYRAMLPYVQKSGD